MKTLLLIWTTVLAAAVAGSYPSEPELCPDEHPPPPPPVVNLPYEKHQALVNNTGKYYNFTNIPYAESPTGPRRWRTPEPRTTKTDGINTGAIGRICHQQRPAWVGAQPAFVGNFSQSNDTDLSQFTDSVPDFTVVPLTDPDPRSSEDCLVLDVVVPQGIWDNKGRRGVAPAPVMVWIHSGYFTYGDKNWNGSPEGIFQAAANMSKHEGDNVIWVAMNYRLGATGFLNSKEFIAQGGTPNVGLLDQRLALKWVQKYIGLFGGDPHQVTVFGENSGASSIMFHLTNYGGEAPGSAPEFQRAIMQSPAFFPLANNDQQTATWKRFLNLTRTSNLGELRALQEAGFPSVRAGNAEMVFNAEYGTVPYGPSVDGAYVLEPPTRLLSSGKYYWHGAEIMVASNSDEGLSFVAPYVQNDATFQQHFRDLLPGLNDDLVQKIETLYPEINNGTDVRDNIRRLADPLADMVVLCNTWSLLKAFGKAKSYKYIFAVTPGVHGQDIQYTYYQGPPAENETASGSGVTASLVPDAQALQSYLPAFAKYGNPNYAVLEHKHDAGFPTYKNGQVLQIGEDENGNAKIELKDDDINEERCKFWEEAGYFSTREEDAQAAKKQRFLGGKMDLRLRL